MLYIEVDCEFGTWFVLVHVVLLVTDCLLLLGLVHFFQTITMSLFLKAVCRSMERVAPLRLAEKWDNVRYCSPT